MGLSLHFQKETWKQRKEVDAQFPSELIPKPRLDLVLSEALVQLPAIVHVPTQTSLRYLPSVSYGRGERERERGREGERERGREGERERSVTGWGRGCLKLILRIFLEMIGIRWVGST